jgi:Transaldolase/Fructose-6-phosphate aldolase
MPGARLKSVVLDVADEPVTVGPADDLGWLDLIGDIRTIYDNYDFKTQILAASIRSANHVKDCALIGADVVTAPPPPSSRRWPATS